MKGGRFGREVCRDGLGRDCQFRFGHRAASFGCGFRSLILKWAEAFGDQRLFRRHAGAAGLADEGANIDAKFALLVRVDFQRRRPANDSGMLLDRNSWVGIRGALLWRFVGSERAGDRYRFRRLDRELRGQRSAGRLRRRINVPRTTNNGFDFEQTFRSGGSVLCCPGDRFLGCVAELFQNFRPGDSFQQLALPPPVLLRHPIAPALVRFLDGFLEVRFASLEPAAPVPRVLPFSCRWLSGTRSSQQVLLLQAA